jgi:CCR4-NOT transcription complex subunit 2
MNHPACCQCPCFQQSQSPHTQLLLQPLTQYTTTLHPLPQDEAQLIAADELCSRGWFWHKKYRCWMIHAPSTMVTKAPQSRSERGSYLVFDTSIWDVVQKADLEISYADVEAPVQLNRNKAPATGMAR